MLGTMPRRIADTILERNRAPLPRPARAPVQRRALVTGGAGFIGSHLVDALLESGWQVAVLDDLSTGRRENVPDGVRLYEYDVSGSGIARVSHACAEERPGVIFHLAAQSSYRLGDTAPAHDITNNVIGTVEVLQAAAAHGARVVLASSAGGVYGGTHGDMATERTSPHPLSVYGASKLAAEQYARLWHERHGVPVTILRLANVYGPRQQPGGEAGVVSIFAGQCLRGEPMTIRGDGLQTRDFVYVADVVRAFIAAADGTSAELWNVLNIASGKETRIVDIADMVGSAAHTSGLPRWDAVLIPTIPGEFDHLALDINEAMYSLGWRAATPLETGIAATVAWVREQIEGQG